MVSGHHGQKKCVPSIPNTIPTANGSSGHVSAHPRTVAESVTPPRLMARASSTMKLMNSTISQTNQTPLQLQLTW